LEKRSEPYIQAMRNHTMTYISKGSQYDAWKEQQLYRDMERLNKMLRVRIATMSIDKDLDTFDLRN